MSHGKIAVLTEAKFEDLELYYPKYRFEEAGYQVEVLTPDGEDREGEHGYPAEASGRIADADPADYLAVHLPGGTHNADTLRTDEGARRFVRAAWDARKPVFAICHGAWLLVDAEVLDGVEMTSYGSLRKDCENAGARWVDRHVVVDGRLVTSRHPPDLPAFAREAVSLLADLEVAAPGAPERARAA